MSKVMEVLHFCNNNGEITSLLLKHSMVSNRVFAIPWTVACQALLFMEFSGQVYRSGLPFPPPGDLPDPGMEPTSPCLLHCRWIIYSWATGKPNNIIIWPLLFWPMSGCPNPRAGREKASKTMQLAKKGKFITDSNQGPCRASNTVRGQRAPSRGGYPNL